MKRVIRLREPRLYWGWQTGTYGARAYCLGKWAILV